MDKASKVARAQMVEEARGNATISGSLDMAALATNLGLEVYEESLRDGNGGYIAYENGDTYIVVNSDDPFTRQRFTIAHEIGHYVNDFDELVKCGRLDRDSNAKSEGPEREADSFAASLLMPEAETREFVEQYDGQSLTSAVIEAIAKHFNVSRTMAVQRLREVGINVPYIVFA